MDYLGKTDKRALTTVAQREIRRLPKIVVSAAAAQKRSFNPTSPSTPTTPSDP